MSLAKRGLPEIPEATRKVAQKAFPRDRNLIMRLRDQLGPLYTDEGFADLFPKRGAPAAEPWRLAWITIFQVMEDLPDRQAAQMVAGRLDWKYALSLPLEDEGLDHSVLSHFRSRLHSTPEAASKLLDPILALAQEQGWLVPNSKMRLDSTMVLAKVRTLSSMETVGESLRATLNTLAEVAPDWLLTVIGDDWFDRYVHRFDLARLPKGEAKKEALRLQVGQDSWKLLQACLGEQAPKPVSHLECVQVLGKVFTQHYEIKAGQVRWRDGPAVCNAERILSPYETEARESQKRETEWDGYKVHLLESCAQKEEAPHLIVGVKTTPATTQDVEVTQPMMQEIQERGWRPKELLVDAGYTSGEVLAKERKRGTEVVGPVSATPGWQNEQKTGMGAQEFEIDWEHQRAICPEGQHSLPWRERKDERGNVTLKMSFATRTCRECEVRGKCTKGERGRQLQILPKEAQEARRARQKEQGEEEFQEKYALRSGIEATIGQGVRKMGLRQSPTRGLQPTHMHHVAIAVGINLIRIDTFLQAKQTGKSPRADRPPSSFERLQKQHCA